MAKINAINNAGASLTIDPGASGDSFVQFNINATGEFRIGVDDDASDAFKISQGSALGTNDTFVMTAAGERTLPLQPSFLAILSTTALNVTGTGAFYTYIPDTEIWDINGDYNNGTGVFTAPITGKYAFQLGGALIGCTTNTQISLKLTTSNRSYQYNFNRAASSSNVQLNFSPICDMDSGDTATFQILGAGEAGVTEDVYGDGTPAGANASCWLLG